MFTPTWMQLTMKLDGKILYQFQQLITKPTEMEGLLHQALIQYDALPEGRSSLANCTYTIEKCEAPAT